MKPLKSIKPSRIPEKIILLLRILELKEMKRPGFSNQIIRKEYYDLKKRWIKELESLLNKEDHPDYSENYYGIIKYADERMFTRYIDLMEKNRRFRERRIMFFGRFNITKFIIRHITKFII